MEHKVVINGVELCYSIFNADFMKNFHNCLNKVKTASEKSAKSESMHELITSQCSAIYEFFAELFGREKADAIFSDEYDLMLYLERFGIFTKSVEEQMGLLDSLTAKYFSDENA